MDCADTILVNRLDRARKMKMDAAAAMYARECLRRFGTADTTEARRIMARTPAKSDRTAHLPETTLTNPALIFEALMKQHGIPTDPEFIKGWATYCETGVAPSKRRFTLPEMLSAVWGHIRRKKP